MTKHLFVTAILMGAMGCSQQEPATPVTRATTTSPLPKPKPVESPPSAEDILRAKLQAKLPSGWIAKEVSIDSRNDVMARIKAGERFVLLQYSKDRNCVTCVTVFENENRTGRLADYHFDAKGKEVATSGDERLPWVAEYRVVAIEAKNCYQSMNN